MSADAIVYCLEHLTDYPQFERFCSDVMNQSGFKDIEPLGGSSDRGRDALHISRTDSNDITIFAYSVRPDWQRKLLQEDCERIREEKHVLKRLVFACTSAVNSTQRDWAKRQVRQKFGWSLELFDLERFRIRLTGDLRSLIAHHPGIFIPQFFPRRGGLSISECRDTLVIDHSLSDHAVATWLARRLQLARYRTWCNGTAPLAGETVDESVRQLIEKRAVRYLPILSAASTADADFLARCALASATQGLVLPCVATHFEPSCLPMRLRDLAPVRFTDGFGPGLSCLLASLDANAVKPTLELGQGRSIALRSYVPQPVTQPTPERVYANTFPVAVPDAIQLCHLSRELSEEEEHELRRTWAFIYVSPTRLLAFDDPPSRIPLAATGRLPAYDWKYYEFYQGKRSVDAIKELISRSLDVACVRAGLKWCNDRRVFYFPHHDKPLRNVPFVHVDGRRTRVAVTGEHVYGTGESAAPFRYQLSPHFRVGRDADGRWWVTLRIYVRVTDRQGKPYEKTAIIRRRKKVAKHWWNKEWFARTLGVIQALSEGREDILVGSGPYQLVISTRPLGWDCPVSIDYRAVERVGDFQEEMAQLRYVDAENSLAEEIGAAENQL